jgi:HlyD family secretion protein
MDREIEVNVRHRRLFLSGLRVAAILAAAALALVYLTGMLKPTLKRDRIRTARVERGTVEAVITAAGIVQPATEQVVSSPIEARVVRVLHQPGAFLEAGEAILELDTSQAKLDLAGFGEDIEQTKGRRRELELQLEETLIDLKTRQEIQALDVEQLDYQVQQNEQLSKEGLLSEAALRQSETQLKKARALHGSVERSINNARARVRSQLGSLDSELRTLERRQGEARRRLELATTRTERAGVLTWVVEEEGATVRAGDAVARIADLGSFRVEATVSDIHAARLHPGLSVRVPVGEELLAGVLDRVHPAVEAGTSRFWVELDEPSHKLLRANLRVDALVVTDKKEDVLLLRKGPFANGSGRQEVFVVDGDRAHRREVRLGLSGFEHYEVVEGLASGEEVVLTKTDDVIHLLEIEIE